jgi:K+-transporting ATPase c subunit
MYLKLKLVFVALTVLALTVLALTVMALTVMALTVMAIPAPASGKVVAESGSVLGGSRVDFVDKVSFSARN